MRVRWLTLTVVVALAIATLLSVLGRRGTPGVSAAASHLGPIPVARGAIRTEGAPMADGFTVAPGTALVGAPFPQGGAVRGFADADAGRSWTAVLLVTGDVRAATREYAQQARALGLTRSVGASCTSSGAFSRCSDLLTDDTTSRAASIVAVRGAGASGPTSHLQLGYVDSGSPNLLPDGSDPVVEIERTTRLPRRRSSGDMGRLAPLPRTWSPLPGPGEAMFVTSGFGQLRHAVGEPVRRFAAPPPMRIERGSELAAPAGVESAGSAWLAVLRVIGDPRRVIERYRDQLRSLPDFDGSVGKIRRDRVGDAFTYTLTADDSSPDFDGRGVVYGVSSVDGPEGAWMMVFASAA